MIAVCMRTVKLLARLHGMRIACPRTAGHTTHHIPQHSGTQDFVYPLTTVAHHAETAVDGFSDTYATSQILAAALSTLGVEKDDIVMCGRQAIDGDTAQVGPQIAEKLHLPQVTYAADIKKDGDTITVQRMLEDGYMTIKVQTPCLLTCIKELNNPRYMSIGGILSTYSKPLTTLGYEDLKDHPLIDATTIGLKGSPTNIFKSFTPPQKGVGMMLEGDGKETCEKLAGILAAKHII